ncbi:Nn.00g085810.m01.CDS01 [Neocucurbitaria sp. VM-36]
MKAAQFFGQRDIRVVHVPKPEPKDHEALIAIEWCGICGSDLHEYIHGPMAIPRKERPHPATGEHIPVTMGHEPCGRIITAPPGSNLTPGQAVMIDPRIYCSKCPRCETGNTHLCTTGGFKGLSGTGGGFSETVAINAKQLYPLPDSIDLSLAALIEPLAVAWHAVALCDISDWSKQSALIIGGGPVGIAHSFVLRSHGCKKIYISEPTATRSAQNKNIADAVFNPITDNISNKCRELAGGDGVDIVFDCAGVQKGMDAGFEALRYRGTYMNVAAWTTPMVVPFYPFILKEITTKCSLAYDDDDFKETVDAFVAGKFKGVETMVTSRIHIDDISKKGFDELVINKDQHIKILVTPDRSKV